MLYFKKIIDNVGKLINSSPILEKNKRTLVLMTVSFSVFMNNFRKKGYSWLLERILFRSFQELGWIVLLPISMCLHIFGFRRLLIRIEHIGHLATELDTFNKERHLGLLPNKRFFLLAPLRKVSNVHLLNYWRSHVYIITSDVGCIFFEILTKRFFLRHDVSHYISKFFNTQDIYRINQLWGERPPLLTLSHEDEIWGTHALKQLGILEHQWFVCVHVREGVFLPHNELIQSHRNSSIYNTIPAMNEIVQRGGIVVRMGDASMTTLPEMLGVVDYARHHLKSQRMDVVLCAKARFFLGCTSGLAFLSMIFGVPLAHANMIPVQALGIRFCDISIPKQLWSKSLKRYLRYDEIMMMDIGGYYFTHQYENDNIRVDENEQEDILLLAREMLDRLEGKFTETDEESELHNKYMSFFMPGHYSYGGSSRVCTAFLKKYQHLLSI